MMNYVYAIMWLVIGLYLCFFMGKENKLMAFLSIYFFFSAVWWFVDAVSPLDLFAAPYNWIFRGISAVTLILAIIGYYSQKKRLSQADKKDTEKNKDDNNVKNN